MTLRELLALINGTKDEGRMCRNKLFEMNPRVLATEVTTVGSEPSKTVVYENGYIYHEEGKKFTVFHISEIASGDIETESVSFEKGEEPSGVIKESDYIDENWYVRVFMEANDRIISNRDKNEEKHKAFIHKGVIEDTDFVLRDKGPFSDYEDELNEQLMRKVFDLAEAAMDPRDWEIYKRMKTENITRKKIAEDMGITAEAVRKKYNRACKKIDAICDELKKIYYAD